MIYFTLAGHRRLGDEKLAADVFWPTRSTSKQGPAGLSATGYIQVASFVGVLLGGVVADWWMRATPRGRIYTSALGVLLLVPALLGLGCAWSLGAADWRS